MSCSARSEILGIARPIKKAPGTTLTSKVAEVTLSDGDVAEGDEIPYSLVTIKENPIATLKLQKYAKGVSIEMIDTYGYDVAIEKTDNAFLNELRGTVTDTLFAELGKGTLTGSKASFKAALANAKGLVTNQFKKMHLDYGDVVGFVNTMDFYDYLGDVDITVQTQFGMTYVQNFLGYKAIILLSDDELEAGKVIATPASNLSTYYIDASESDYAKAGLVYTVDNETNLIGYHTEGKYSHAVSEMYAILAVKLIAEYANGVAVVTVAGE
jgi:hypothetical protein